MQAGKKPSAKARASTGSVANTAGAAAGSGRGSVKAGSQRTSLVSPAAAALCGLTEWMDRPWLALASAVYPAGPRGAERPQLGWLWCSAFAGATRQWWGSPSGNGSPCNGVLRSCACMAQQQWQPVCFLLCVLKAPWGVLAALQGSAMPSGGAAGGRKKASGRAASGKAAAAVAADAGAMHAPAARLPTHVGLSGGAAGALSGSSCAVGRAAGRGPRSGAAVLPAAVKAEAGVAQAAAAAAGEEEDQQQEVAAAAGQLGVASDVDAPDKENAGAAGGGVKGLGSKAVTAVSSAGVCQAGRMLLVGSRTQASNLHCCGCLSAPGRQLCWGFVCCTMQA